MAKKLTQDYLKNAAYYYLSRFSSSEVNLSQVLQRKALRRLKISGEQIEPDEIDGWIKAVVQSCVELGLLDDAEYAKSKARSLFNRGNSSYQIRQKLRQKGLSEENIRIALEALAEFSDRPDWDAAVRFAKRKRLGVFASQRGESKGTGSADNAKYQKQLQSFMRAGFSVDLARKVLSAKTEDELQQLSNEFED